MIIAAASCIFCLNTQCSNEEKVTPSENSTVETPDPPASNESSNYVVAYLVAGEYVANAVRWHALTHLCVAFIYPREDGTISDKAIAGNIRSIVDEAHRNNKKVLISIRDEVKGDFAGALLNNKTKLADNLLDYVEKNNLDGFDIDFEDWSATDVVTHLIRFSKELYQRKGEKLIQSCAVNTWDQGYTTEWHKYYDIINVMAYDQHGPWNTEGQHSPYNESIESIIFWRDKMEAPAEKLVLGVPFYGYSWNEGDEKGQAYRYRQILEKYPDIDVASRDQIDRLYYNGKATILKKCKWVKENKIKGIMIWQIFQDATDKNDSLLEAIGTTMLGEE
jgi:spore germination protein YaaH